MDQPAERPRASDSDTFVAVIGGGLRAYAGDETRREILRVLRADAPVVLLRCHLAVHERTVGPFLAYRRRHVGPALVEPFQLNAHTERFLRSPTILDRGIEVHRFDARRLEAFVLSSSSGPNTTASSRCTPSRRTQCGSPRSSRVRSRCPSGPSATP